MEGYLVDVGGEAHLVKDLLQIQVVSADVEPKLVQDHLQLILKFSSICSV